jgi:ketosteroid isomerase-like protein
MENKQLVQTIMDALARAERQPLFDAMADEVSWRWMGVSSWSKTFQGKEQVVGQLFGGVEETLTSFSVDVHHIVDDGEHVVVEHTGHNTTPDGRRYDNNYCWVFSIRNGLIQEIREYMDTQLVTETFADDPW